MTTTEGAAPRILVEPRSRIIVNGSSDEMSRQVPLTVDQYHQMIESGILSEGAPIELLDGLLVPKDRSAAGKDPRSAGPDHALTVKKLARLDRKLERFGCHIQTQPVTIPNHDEPEPDGAILLGKPEDYAGRNPGPGDVTCLIEVADSSLRVDRTRKLRIYADAGIPQYLIFNLVDHVVEVYSKPMVGRGHYAESTTLQRGKRVELLAGKQVGTASKTGLVVPVNSLLPYIQ